MRKYDLIFRLWAIVVLILCLQTTVFAEAFKEFSITVQLKDRKEIPILTRLMGIDSVDGLLVKGVATQKELEKLSEAGFHWKIVAPPAKVTRGMASTIAQLRANWDLYPTYGVYEQLMAKLAADYPSICQYVEIGTLASGRKLMFLKISDNVSLEEDEPEVMLESTMHGDETTGFVLLLRLADHMLAKYGQSDAEALRIANIIDNVELWIMPDFNPDGTYHGGDSTVSSATRSNANGVDLNRNFPDPVQGAHPDGNSYQAETTAMMNFADQHSFSLSANYHGGAELYNLPWDSMAQLHPDDDWFWGVFQPIVAHIQSVSSSGYMDDSPTGTPGITNGYAWYAVYGGRQDWMTYFKRGREVTIELSGAKNPPSSSLPDYWNWNREAFYMLIEESLKGIRGIVKDQVTGNPISAEIDIIGRGENPVETVFTDPDVGNYHRMLLPGTYTLKCTASGYAPITVQGVTVSSGDATRVDILMNSTYLSYDTHTISDICDGALSGGDGVLDAGEKADLLVKIKNTGVSNASNVTAVLSTTDPAVVINSAVSSYPDIAASQAQLPLGSGFNFSVDRNVPCGTQLQFRLDMYCDQGSYNTTFSVTVGSVSVGTTIAFNDDFETDRGWTLESAGEWQRGAPSGSGGTQHGNPDPSAAVSGSMVLGNDLSGMGSNTYDYEPNVDTSTATSPAIDCSNLSNVTLSFKRWLNIEAPQYDRATVQVSNDGTTWNTVWKNGGEITDSAWTAVSYDISTYADGQQRVYIRFVINSDGSWQFSGWNIDDLEVSGSGSTNCTMNICRAYGVPSMSLFGLIALIFLMMWLIHSSAMSFSRKKHHLPPRSH